MYIFCISDWTTTGRVIVFVVSKLLDKLANRTVMLTLAAVVFKLLQATFWLLLHLIRDTVTIRQLVEPYEGLPNGSYTTFGNMQWPHKNYRMFLVPYVDIPNNLWWYFIVLYNFSCVFDNVAAGPAELFWLQCYKHNSCQSVTIAGFPQVDKK